MINMVKYEIEGKQQITKKTKKFGDGTMVCLPKKWGYGAEVIVILMNEGEIIPPPKKDKKKPKPGFFKK